MLPISIFTEEFRESIANAEAIVVGAPEENEEVLPTDIYAVDELVDKRTEFSKEFLLSNGLHMATVYADAVHYETENGWEEIDNTLKVNTDGTSTNTLVYGMCASLSSWPVAQETVLCVDKRDRDGFLIPPEETE